MCAHEMNSHCGPQRHLARGEYKYLAPLFGSLMVAGECGGGSGRVYSNTATEVIPMQSKRSNFKPSQASACVCVSKRLQRIIALEHVPHACVRAWVGYERHKKQAALNWSNDFDNVNAIR